MISLIGKIFCAATVTEISLVRIYRHTTDDEAVSVRRRRERGELKVPFAIEAAERAGVQQLVVVVA